MRQGIAGAVEAIYEAASSPAAWPEVLAALAALTGASAAILLVGPSAGALAPLATFGLDDLDPNPIAGAIGAALLARLGAHSAGTLVTTTLPGSPTGCAGEGALAVLASGARLGEAAGICLLHERGGLAGLWLFRPVGEGFDPSDLGCLRDLTPHLTRALAIHLRVERAERAATEARDAFDRVALGTVLVDEEARPILANRAAERIAAQQDGFLIAADGLRGATPADTRMLQRAIAKVARGGSRTGLGLRLSRTPSSRPYEVMIVPISRGRRWPAHRPRTAIVFISDCGLSFVSPAQLVHDLYGLTAAETRLALLLLGGQSMPEAAATLGVSRNTAHSQLASIFRKTQTTSQAELVRVLLRGPGAVRVPGDSSDAYPRVEPDP